MYEYDTCVFICVKDMDECVCEMFVRNAYERYVREMCMYEYDIYALICMIYMCLKYVYVLIYM